MAALGINTDSFVYSRKGWAAMKVATGLFWLWEMWRVLFVNHYSGNPYPEGVSRLFDVSFLSVAPVSYVVFALAVAGVVFYFLEKQMAIALGIISAISVLVFTIERANGVQSRSELLSMIFIAQWVAYLVKRKEADVHNTAIFFSVQMVAAAYTMSGITKLMTSGLDWIVNPTNAVLQITKIFGQLNIELGFKAGIAYSKFTTGLLLHYPYLAQFLFAAALGIEVFAFTCVFSKPWARRYGLLLLALHIGMLFTVGIAIPVFVLMLLVYPLNVFGPLTPKGEQSNL